MQKEYKLVIIAVSFIIGIVLVFSGVNYLYNLSKTSQGYLRELFVVGEAVAPNYFDPCEIPDICNGGSHPAYCNCYWIYHNECNGEYPELYEWLSKKCDEDYGSRFAVDECAARNFPFNSHVKHLFCYADSWTNLINDCIDAGWPDPR